MITFKLSDSYLCQGVQHWHDQYFMAPLFAAITAATYFSIDSSSLWRNFESASTHNSWIILRYCAIAWIDVERYVLRFMNRLWNQHLKSDQTFSKGFKSDDWEGQHITAILCSSRNLETWWSVWHGALSYIHRRLFSFVTWIISWLAGYCNRLSIISMRLLDNIFIYLTTLISSWFRAKIGPILSLQKHIHTIMVTWFDLKLGTRYHSSSPLPIE